MLATSPNLEFLNNEIISVAYTKPVLNSLCLKSSQFPYIVRAKERVSNIAAIENGHSLQLFLMRHVSDKNRHTLLLETALSQTTFVTSFYAASCSNYYTPLSRYSSHLFARDYSSFGNIPLIVDVSNMKSNYMVTKHSFISTTIGTVTLRLP